MTDPTQTVEPRRRRRARGATLGVVVIHTEIGGVSTAPIPVRRTLRLGRDETSEITIADPGISRVHLELSPDAGALRIRDLGSRNGSLLDGQPIDGEARAQPGAILRLGHTLLHVTGDVEALSEHPNGGGAPLIGGPALALVRDTIRDLAVGRAPVLVEGPSGTGKEVVCRLLHEASGRSGSLIAVNCAAIAPQLLESELFGHARGAFSGSEGQREGLFRAADGGTLMLDELGELAPAAQAKLLRALEAGEVRAVGEDRPRSVDVRVVCATNRDLAAMVEEGRFRADLFHRVAADRITLPALATRREDIPALARAFLPDPGVSISTDAMEELMGRSLTGNVRELKNLVTAAAARARREGAIEILPDHWPAGRPGVASRLFDADTELRARLETALELHRGNVSEVARALGVRRAGLYDQFRRLGLDPSRYR